MFLFFVGCVVVGCLFVFVVFCCCCFLGVFFVFFFWGGGCFVLFCCYLVVFSVFGGQGVFFYREAYFDRWKRSAKLQEDCIATHSRIWVNS